MVKDIWKRKPEKMLSTEARSWLAELQEEWNGLQEKAEKWNEICEGLEYGGNTPVGDILLEINLIDRDNNTRRDKLEAVKNYVAKLRGVEEKVKMTGSSEIADALEKILEGGSLC